MSPELFFYSHFLFGLVWYVFGFEVFCFVSHSLSVFIEATASRTMIQFTVVKQIDLMAVLLVCFLDWCWRGHNSDLGVIIRAFLK